MSGTISNQPQSESGISFGRRRVLHFGTLITAFTGASVLGADTAGAVTTLEPASNEMIDTFAAGRVDRLGVSKLAQSQAMALKAKADGVPAPSPTTAVTANGQRAVIYLPLTLDRAVPIPLVIHFHGADANATTEVQWQPMWEAAQASGFAVATCDFHGNAYGSPTVMADARAVLDVVLKIAPINGLLLSGESMGGISALNALTRKALPNVLGAYLSQPIVSLRHRYDNGRGPEIRASYGISPDGSDYATKTAGYDPDLEPGSRFGGVPLYITSSTSDSVALKNPFIDNLMARVSGYSPITFAPASGGHGDPSHFIPGNYVSFFRECAAGLVAPASPSASKTDSTAAATPLKYDFTADPSLVCDFDAATIGLANGAAVKSWATARGSATSPLVQGVAAYQPVFAASEAAINNRPCVTFGPDDFLDTGAWTTSVSTPATIITVVQVDTTQAPNPFWTGRNGVYMYASTTAAGINVQTASTGGIVSAASAGSHWRVIAAVYDGASSRLYVGSKVPIYGATGTTADGPNAKLPGIKLNTSSGGTAGNGNTPRFSRFAAVGRALSHTEVSDTLDNLATTYGLTIN